VDLNPVAVSTAKKRFEIFNLDGDIREADGEELPFEDNTFDYVYSWGVLHHSPNTKKSIAELYRVMKRGARAGVMLYHRRSLMYRFFTEYVDGFVNMESKFLSPLELASRYGDGDRREGNPHTWPVTKKEVYKDLFQQFRNVRIDVLGIEVEQIMDQWARNFGSKFPRALLNACIRRWGWSLWITGEK
jgi:ubiquinone/menaquinone biosynthesis C-methylase UbiE